MSGWVLGLVLGMASGLLYSFLFLKESEKQWQWRRQTEKEKRMRSQYPGEWD
jgi:hypothetical protein